MTLCGAVAGGVAERLLLPWPLLCPLPTKAQDVSLASLCKATESSICCAVTLCGAASGGLDEDFLLPQSLPPLWPAKTQDV